MRRKGSSKGPTLTGSLASLTARDTPSKEAKNLKGKNDKGFDPQGTNPPTEEEGSTPPPIAASGRTHATGAAKDRGPLEANPDNKQARPTGGTHAQKEKGQFEAMGREEERSGGGPPPDATKREGGTGTSRNTGSIEDLSMSESSLTSKDTTPPIVVMVVPGTGQRHNGPREAILQSEKLDRNTSHATGATRPAAQPQGESDGGELVDGEMIYLDDGATVDSITTCSDTESARADHSDQENPPWNSRLRHTPTAVNNPSTPRTITSAHNDKQVITTDGSSKKAGQRRR